MPAAAGTPTPASRDASVADVAAFMADCSFEATRPSAADVAALGRTLKPGAHVYLTAIPGKPLEEIVASCAQVRAQGLEPVPHISARQAPDMATIRRFVEACVAQAAVTRVMLIGGDTAKPVGSVRDALSVIESGLFEANGIVSVGLAGFPDGHPAMGEEELEANLVTKLAALQQRGVEGHIVTQFCFDAQPMLQWVDWLRARGVHAPVRLGFAGPTSLLTWLNYARKCGVKASAEALASRSGLVKQAFKPVAPDPLIRQVAAAHASGLLEGVKPHLFAFGGIGQTAQWAKAPIDGAIRLTKDGFEAV